MTCKKVDSKLQIQTRSRIVPAARASPHDGLLRAARAATRAVARSRRAQGGIPQKNAAKPSRYGGAGSRERLRRTQRGLPGFAGSETASASFAEPGKRRTAFEPNHSAGITGAVSRY